jgi:glutathione S-transferase
VKLYSNQHAVNPRRVRMFVAEKGIDVDVETVEVDIATRENRQPPYLEVNPLGWVPVLELDDGTRIAESIAICRYFEALHPGPPLFGGDDPIAAAQVEQYNRHVEHELLMHVTFAFRHLHDFWKDKIEQVPAWGDLAKRVATERLDWLDGVLDGRPWIAGAHFSVADITALCAIDFARISKIRVGEREHLSRWYAAMKERPSYEA